MKARIWPGRDGTREHPNRRAIRIMNPMRDETKARTRGEGGEMTPASAACSNFGGEGELVRDEPERPQMFVRIAIPGC